MSLFFPQDIESIITKSKQQINKYERFLATKNSIQMVKCAIFLARIGGNFYFEPFGGE